MSCGHKIRIQVRFSSRWVTVIQFGTETKRSGWPIISAANVCQKEGIRGDYGVEFPTADFNVSEVVRWILEQQDASDAASDSHDMQIQLSSDPRTTIPDDEVIFYSQAQYAQFLVRLDEVACCGYIYAVTMQPLKWWCEMAHSMLPLHCWRDEDIWMSNDPNEIDKITEDIRAKQAQLCAVYKIMLVENITSLPTEVVYHIAEFAVPYADDVRVALWSDKSWTKMLRSGQNIDWKQAIYSGLAFNSVQLL